MCGGGTEVEQLLRTYYNLCETWILFSKIETCSLIQHIITECYRWTGNSSFEKKAEYKRQPIPYEGCRAPHKELTLKAALGIGCYCRSNMLEFTTKLGGGRCIRSHEACSCAKNVLINGKRQLVETKNAILDDNCNRICECLHRGNEQGKYYGFHCRRYAMPENTVCITEAQAQTNMVSFPTAWKRCTMLASIRGRYQLAIGSSKQVWCMRGYAGCPMAGERCTGTNKQAANNYVRLNDESLDVDECLLMSDFKIELISYYKKLVNCENGVCVNTVGDYECKCNRGFAHPMGNRQKCVPKQTASNEFYDLETCQTAQLLGARNDDDLQTMYDPSSPCNPNPCSVHASCIADTRRITGVTCTCHAGYVSGNTGYVCDIDECKEKKHMCVLNSQCHNTVGSYECKCLPGFVGSAIDECKDFDECASGRNECDENAQCQNLFPGYRCYCNAAWNGNPMSTGTISDRCIDTNECLNPNSCGMNTNCENTPGSYVCECIPGGFRKRDERNCEDINECTERAFQKPPCDAHANCVNIPGSYTCECQAGYIGDGFTCAPDDSICERCDKKSTECVLDPSKDQYACVCKKDYKNAPYSEYSCIPELSCVNPAKHDCDKIHGTSIDPCASNPCREKNTICKRTMFGTYMCHCLPGFFMVNRECVKNCRRCDRLTERCIKDTAMKGKWKCVCKDGYALQSDQSCKNIDECLTPDENRCDPNFGLCFDEVPHIAGHAYSCKCKSGFVGNDIDECKNAKEWCPNEHSYCLNTVGSYTCLCDKGFEPLWSHMEQPVVCKDRNECLNEEHNCTLNSECVNEVGGFRCECTVGFRLSNGECVDIDECVEGGSNCDQRSEDCHNTIGSFTCACKSGFRFEYPGICVDINECVLDFHNCTHSGELCVNTEPGFKCVCGPGFSSSSPDSVPCVDVNECARNTARCPNTTTCINTVGSYYCVCKDDYVLIDDSNPSFPLCRGECRRFSCRGIAPCLLDRSPTTTTTGRFTPLFQLVTGASLRRPSVDLALVRGLFSRHSTTVPVSRTPSD
ncbi:unnamed protein product [Soboliphyme baturini]|uniref:EGF-like domain-containing protein n=1 Tax=Soboliphyme baturini TaxID=241478 RepID=A0A183IVG7_9BILA|nr:unnamed protein product [Soboliphyme baturini]